MTRQAKLGPRRTVIADEVDVEGGFGIGLWSLKPSPRRPLVLLAACVLHGVPAGRMVEREKDQNRHMVRAMESSA